MSDISDKIKKMVYNHLAVSLDTIVDSASFIDDLGADSLDSIELVIAIENKFDIVISDEEAQRATTIGAITALAEEKVKAINTIKRRGSPGPLYRGAPSG